MGSRCPVHSCAQGETRGTQYRPEAGRDTGYCSQQAAALLRSVQSETRGLPNRRTFEHKALCTLVIPADHSLRQSTGLALRPSVGEQPPTMPVAPYGPPVGIGTAQAIDPHGNCHLIHPLNQQGHRGP